MRTPFDQTDALRREFQGASDRAAAVVAGAFLDEVLQELLREFFVEQTPAADKKLFEGTGPLATFSSKIDVAFRVGLISEGEHRTLHTIRGIGNDFAHDLGDVSFEAQSIRARCMNIEVPVAMVSPQHIPLSQAGEAPPLPVIVKASNSEPRSIFQEAVITLMHVLPARVADASRVRRTSPLEFTLAHEPGERIFLRLRGLLERYEALSQSNKISAEEKVKITEDLNRYGILVRVQQFCIQQIRRAHELLQQSI